MVNVGTYTHTWSIWVIFDLFNLHLQNLELHIFFKAQAQAHGGGVNKAHPLLGGVQPIGFLKFWNEANTSSFEKPAWAAGLAPGEAGGKGSQNTQKKHVNCLEFSSMSTFHHHSALEVWLKRSEIPCNSKTRSEFSHAIQNLKLRKPKWNQTQFHQGPPILFQIEMLPQMPNIWKLQTTWVVVSLNGNPDPPPPKKQMCPVA